MTIRQIGGVFGRNPKFNDVEAETLEVSGSITSGGDPTFEGASGRSLTLKNTSGAATAGDLIGEVLFYGSDASAPGAGIKSKIKVIADGGSGDGSRLFISTSDGVTNDIDRMEFTKDGDVKVLTGNLVIGTSGQGIDFSATSGTGTSELFDDYEEGTWTPELTFGGGSTGITYTARPASYIKIGRMVFFTLGIQLSNKGTDTGSAQITGLPFTAISGSYRNSAVAMVPTLMTLTGTPLGLVNQGATTINLVETTTTGRTSLTEASFANNSYFWLTGTYFAV